MAESQHNAGIRITGDASGLVAAGKQAVASQKDLESAFKKTEEQQKRNADESQRFVARLKEEAETAGKSRTEIERYQAGHMQLTGAQKQSAEASLKSIEAHDRQAQSIAFVRNAAIIAAAAIAAYAAAAVVGAVAAKDQAASLHNLSKNYGVSTETLSAYRYQMTIAGVTQEDFSAAIKVFSKNIAEARGGVGDGAALFRLLGKDMEGAVRSGAPLEALLPMLADKFAQFADGPNKVAFGIRLLGPAFERVNPEISKGSAGMREAAKEAAELGQIIGQGFARNADQFNANMARTNAMFTATKYAIAEFALPALNTFMERLLAAGKAQGNFVTKLLAFSKNPRGEDDDWQQRFDAQEANVQALWFKKDAPVYTGSAAAAESDYKRLNREIRTHIELLTLQASSGEKLTQGDQIRVQLLQDQRDRVTKLSQAEVDRLVVEANKLRAIELDQRAREAAKKSLEDYNNALSQYLTKQYQEIQQGEDANKKQREANEELGKTTEELGRLKVARAEETLALLRQKEAISNVIEAGEGELEIARSRVKQAEEFVRLMREGSEKSVAVEQAKTAKDAWKSTSDSIERTLTDALMRGFDKGKTFAQNLRDAMVNMFKTLVLEPIIRPIAQQGAGMVLGAMGMPNAAGGASGGGLGGLSNLSSLSNLFSGNSGGMFSTSAPSWYTAGLADGSIAAGATEAGAGLYAAGGAAIGGAALGGTALAGEAAALGVGSMYGGAAAGGALAGGAAAGLAAVPVVGWIALAALAAYSLMSDKKDKRKESQLGLMGGPGNYYIGQNNVPGGEGNYPLYDTLNAGFNDPTKYDQSVLAQNAGKFITGGQGEGAESMVQKLLLALDGAAIAAQATAAATDQMKQSLRAAQDPMGFWSAQVSQVGAELGSSADTVEEWRAEFLSALDGALTPGQFAKWQQFGQVLEQAARAGGRFAESIAGLASSAQTSAQLSARLAEQARSTAEDYRRAASALASSGQGLQLSDLSPLTMAQRLSTARGGLDAVYGRALGGDREALGALPDSAHSFLDASRAYNASSPAYSADFNEVLAMLGQSGLNALGFGAQNDYQATLLELQGKTLESIMLELQKPSPDTGILTDSRAILATIDGQLVTLGGLSVNQVQTMFGAVAAQEALVNLTGANGSLNQTMLQQLASQLADLTGANGSLNQTMLQQLASQRALADLTAANGSLNQTMLQQLASQSALERGDLAGINTSTGQTVDLLGRLIQQQGDAARAAESGAVALLERLVQQQGDAARAADRAAALESFTRLYDQPIGRDWSPEEMGNILAAFNAYWQAIPGHAAGLPIVPADNYLARLHRDEAVIDAPTMAGLRRYGIDVRSEGGSSAELRRELAELRATMQRMERAFAGLPAAVREQTRALVRSGEDNASAIARANVGVIEASARA